MIRKWPRYCEIALGLWLVASGWVLQQPDPSGYIIIAAATGLAVIALDVLSISGRLRYAHLLILAVATIQVCLTFWFLPGQSPGAQNLITVALLLAIVAILPTEATEPPPAWREFVRRS